MRVLLDLRVSESVPGLSRESGAQAWILSRALAQGLRDRHDAHVLLDGRFPEHAAKARDALAGVLPPESIHLWLSPPQDGLRTEAANEAAAHLREAVVARLRPDVVFVADPGASPAETMASVPVVRARAALQQASNPDVADAVRVAIERPPPGDA